MYLRIKYNTFYKYIINDTTTKINACKNEKEVIYFCRLSTGKGEYSII
jgi:hypothetical protein